MWNLSAAQHLVLDNLRMGWSYRTNMAWDLADEAYLWCVRNELIRDGKITPLGLQALSEPASRTSR